MRARFTDGTCSAYAMNPNVTEIEVGSWLKPCDTLWRVRFVSQQPSCPWHWSCSSSHWWPRPWGLPYHNITLWVIFTRLIYFYMQWYDTLYLLICYHKGRQSRGNIGRRWEEFDCVKGCNEGFWRVHPEESLQHNQTSLLPTIPARALCGREMIKLGWKFKFLHF